MYETIMKPIATNISGQALRLLDVSPGCGHTDHKSGIAGL